MPEIFEFSPEELAARYLDHFKLADDYAKAFSADFKVQIGISKRHLYLTVVSAYQDIARYKNFHLDNPFAQKSDAVKRASYLAKWISRFKPLYIAEGELNDLASTEFDKALIVNELFALHLAAVHLSVDANRSFVIKDQKSYEVAYEMMYRHLNEDAYLLIFQMIKDHILNSTEIVQLF